MLGASVHNIGFEQVLTHYDSSFFSAIFSILLTSIFLVLNGLGYVILAKPDDKRLCNWLKMNIRRLSLISMAGFMCLLWIRKNSHFLPEFYPEPENPPK